MPDKITNKIIKKPVPLRHGIVLGAGCPKICVPVIGDSKPVFLQNLVKACDSSPDLIELRIDSLARNLSESDLETFLFKMVSLTRATCPVILTERSCRDGGEGDSLQYVHLLSRLLESYLPVDLIDIEISAGADDFSVLRRKAAAHRVPVIASWHDFSGTPSAETLLGIFKQMEAWGADIAKIAVMPHTEKDVGRLTAAAKAASGTLSIPLIAISMGDIGKRTRLDCAQIGSCMTFAAAGDASAPGQISVSTIREQMKQALNKTSS